MAEKNRKVGQLAAASARNGTMRSSSDVSVDMNRYQKRDLPVGKFRRFLEPGPIVLVSSKWRVTPTS